MAAPAYKCQACGKPCIRWSAQCPNPECRAFSSLARNEGSAQDWVRSENTAVLISEIERKDVDRIVSATREINRVLGGGWKIGGAYLIYADPGAGKSTLCLQECIDLPNAEVDIKGGDEPYEVMYVSAEETAAQIADRNDRLAKHIEKSNTPGSFYLLIQSDVHKIEEEIIARDPDLVVIDSIQTMKRGDIDAPAGSLTQVKESAAHLVGLCKSRNIVIVMIAHVTKGGDVAGPKTLEHLVDAELELEHDTRTGMRILRASKNRFGSTQEMGIFEMTQSGLRSIENPSQLLLNAHVEGVPGVCIAVTCPGLRPVLCEVQCLLGSKRMGSEGKRYCKGIAPAVVAQAVAILHRRCGINISDRDLHVNVAGGLIITDPGIELPLCLALASAALDYALPSNFAAFGEVGLAGEVRSAPYGELRLKAAALMQFEETMGPAVEGPVMVNDEDALEAHTSVQLLSDAFDVLEWNIGKPAVKKSRKKAKVGKLKVVK